MKAEEGKQEILITREFDLPLELLFRAYVEPDIVEQWMGTKVLNLECKQLGSYHFETSDPHGNKFSLIGVIHEFIPNYKITRTFEMENAGYGVQLEFLEFEKLTEDTSKLHMHIVFRSTFHRDQMLEIPFAYGLSMAHDRLQLIVKQLK
ncbi:MAG: SRPBCC domain-containing protein [Saprospiraceae bacterium]|nr:SRPBCC domain-containing protein [Saprospiraceae bacterium]